MTKALGKEGSFAEGRSIALGKDFFKKNKISATFLCRGTWLEALGKDFLEKFCTCLCKNNSLPRAPGDGPRQILRPRRRRRDGCFSLSSAAPALGKVPDKKPSAKTLFADSKFPESSLPRAAFAEGLRPSAKRPSPLVASCLLSTSGYVQREIVTFRGVQPSLVKTFPSSEFSLLVMV